MLGGRAPRSRGGSWESPERAFEAGARESEELRGRGEIPVRVRRVGVAEVRGELRELCLDIEAGAIPVREGADGKGVAEIVKPWPMAAGAVAEARRVRDVAEDAQEPRVGERRVRADIH